MDLTKSLKLSLQGIFKNEEQLEMTSELCDKLSHVTNIVDQIKSIVDKFSVVSNDNSDEIRNILKETYNVNWFLSNEIEKGFKDINSNLGEINKNTISLSNQIKSLEKPDEDYLKEQREQTKIYQSTMTNKLLSDILKEVRAGRIGINNLKLSGGNDGEGILGGLGKLLGLGAGAATLKVGSKMLGGKATKKAKDIKNAAKLLKLFKYAKTGVKGLKLLSGASIVGLPLLIADEVLGVSDYMLDEMFEKYTGVEVKREQETILKRLFNAKHKLSDLTPDFVENLLAKHPAHMLSEWVWDQTEEALGYKDEFEKEIKKQEIGLMGKTLNIMKGLGGFFEKHNPMDILYTLYTDEKGFNQILNEFSDILLGNTPELSGLSPLEPTEDEIKSKMEEKKKVKVIEQSKDGSFIKAKAPERPKKLSTLDEIISSVANESGLDPALVKAVIATESSFNPNAVSHTGNVGYMQLSESASKDVGMDWETVKTDPEANIKAGTAYLAQQLRRFKDNKELALAAYNAGPTLVSKLGRIPSNQETTNYVPKVLANYEKYKNEGLASVREPQNTDILKAISISEQPSNDSSNQTIINNMNENNNINENQNLTRLNANSPFELAYAKLFMNPNYLM